MPRWVIYVIGALCFIISFLLFGRCATATGGAFIGIASALTATPFFWSFRLYAMRRGWYRDEHYDAYHPPRRRHIALLAVASIIPMSFLCLFLIMAANSGCFSAVLSLKF